MKYKNTTDYAHGTQQKIGVLMVNLGTPEAPTKQALKPYLKQFLSDPRVVEVPRLIWYLVLNGIILNTRPKRSAEAYASIWQEQGSPLLTNTKAISEAVQSKFDEQQVDIEVRFAMRYGQPDVDGQITELLQKGVTKLLVLPLYPQYSATTTGSTFDAIADSFTKRRWFPELRFVNQYVDEPLFIKALADKIQRFWDEHGQAEKLILTYHGIPKRYWDNGDPYICQCHKTTRLVREALGVDEDKIMTCFQSRFGKEEWVKPYLDETLKSMPAAGVKSVQVMSPGFSADCLETLEEIAEENQEYFLESGGEKFQYIPCLNDDELHIDALVSVIDNNIAGWSVAQNPEQTEALAQALKSSIVNKNV